ncbi:MAG: polysaccharide biosynthesis tyrosine autokinase [Aestuariivirga sp.]
MNDAGTSQPVEQERPQEQIQLMELSDQFSLAQLLQIYHRRKRLLFSLIVLIMLLAALVIFLIPQKYTAESSVLIDPRRQQVVNIDSVMSDLLTDAPTIESEIEVIRSRDLANRLINKLRLDLVAELNPAAGRGNSAGSWLPDPSKYLPEGWVDAVRGQLQVEELKPEVVAEIDRAEVIERIEKALRVTSVGRSRVIQIAFESRDRELAARVANTLAELYVEAQVEAKLAATRQAAEWLEGRVQDLRGKVELAENAVEAFRAERGLVMGESSGAIAQQISQLRVQLLLAQADYEVEKSRRDGRSSAESVAAARVQALTNSLQSLLADITRTNQDEVHLRALEREAAAERSLLEIFLNRSKQTEQPGLEQPDARIISRADIPISPSFPKKFPALAFALALACLLSVGAVFTVESLEPGFRTLGQIESELGLRVLGIYPQVQRSGWSRRKVELQDYLLQKPLSRHAEALRSIFTTLVQRMPQARNGHVVSIVSAMPGEGKSTLVSSLARMVAKSGYRVLAIDCDLRHPKLHRYFHLFGVNKAEDLSEYLKSGEGSDNLAQSDGSSSAKVIATTPRPDQPELLLLADRLKSLIEALRPQYDIILIDTPPVALFSDASELSRLSDQCVLVVQWLKSRRAAVGQALKALTDAGANVVGAVMTKVDLKRYSQHDYEGGGYYYGDYAKYYDRKST